MSVYYYFQNLGRREHLEAYLGEQICGAVDKFLEKDNYKLITRIRAERARNEYRSPEFLCEVRLDSYNLDAPIIVKKIGPNFHHAAQLVAQTLKKILRRQSKKKLFNKRHKSIEKLNMEEVQAS